MILRAGRFSKYWPTNEEEKRYRVLKERLTALKLRRLPRLFGNKSIEAWGHLLRRVRHQEFTISGKLDLDKFFCGRAFLLFALDDEGELPNQIKENIAEFFPQCVQAGKFFLRLCPVQKNL